MTATTSWNLTPLTEPLSREQVRAWRREHRAVRFSASPGRHSSWCRSR
ncbi:hypothetical protein [Homoserinibacter gongjuensis]|nr:hypothetical protein [Homoserinibacter gongjuensis]